MTEDIPEEGNTLTIEEHQYAEKCQKIIQKIERISPDTKIIFSNF